MKDTINMDDGRKADMWDKIVEMVGDRHTVDYVFPPEEWLTTMLQWADEHAVDKLLRGDTGDGKPTSWLNYPVKFITMCKVCYEPIKGTFNVLHMDDHNMVIAKLEPCSICQGNIEAELKAERAAKEKLIDELTRIKDNCSDDSWEEEPCMALVSVIDRLKRSLITKPAINKEEDNDGR